jgi:hypothetical protein
MNRCKKPQDALQVEQTKGNINRNVYSIVVMKTKDLRTRVTAKIPHVGLRPAFVTVPPSYGRESTREPNKRRERRTKNQMLKDEGRG